MVTDEVGRSDYLLKERFEAGGRRETVARRQRLHRSGDPIAHVFLVTAGWFARCRQSAGGAEAFTGLYITGDIIALDALNGGSLPDQVTALTHGAVLRLPLEELLAMIERGGPVAVEIAKRLAADSGLLREALVAVGTQSSQDRLGTFLLQTFRRLVAAGLVAPDARRFELPLTQVQLGAVTGITSVHMNRVLRALRTTGPFDFQAGVVRLHAIPKETHMRLAS